ncbi:MAG: hypothetical protein GX053_03035 [Tissierella sp.]|nr:hypothetical protein [Tissierella sp.]
MWTTVYVASGYDYAQKIEKRLSEEGYIVKTKFFAMEGEEKLYEILAPTFEAEDIQTVLVELEIM